MSQPPNPMNHGMNQPTNQAMSQTDDRRDALFYRDLLKSLFLATGILGIIAMFLVTPGMQAPSLISLILATFITPIVVQLERRGTSRVYATRFILCFLILMMVIFSVWAIRSGISQWAILKSIIPLNFERAMTKLREFENGIKKTYPLFKHLELTKTVLRFGTETARWFVDHGASLLGGGLTWMFLIPLLTYALLNEGPTLRRALFTLVPNRFFESYFLVSTNLSKTIADYLRAKLLEAFLVGLLVTLGLRIIQIPYSPILGIIAGITNIIPYLGPLLGAAAGLISICFDEQLSQQWIAVILVYVAANLIDMIVIFPVVVAKLVKLHPIVLIAVVIAGQQYYGLIGMLISIPIASALKVILQELYFILYEQSPPRKSGTFESDLTPGV